MPKPQRATDLRQYQNLVEALWGKFDIVDAAPAPGDMEVGDALLVDPGGSVASAYKLYIKVSPTTVMVLSASELVR